MKTLILAAFILCCALARATGPEYHSTRMWIEDHCGTNQVPAEQRLFVASCPGSPLPSFAVVMPYREGISLREIIDQTRCLGTNAMVTVLRSKKSATPVYEDSIGASDKPAFVVRRLDVIYICEPTIPNG